MGTPGARVAALDDVLADQAVEKVDLVKLVVDGFERDVLAGAGNTIDRDRPMFLMEIMPYGLVEPGTSLEQMLSYLIPVGYPA